MEEQSEWVKFQDIEWNDPKFNQFNVDTRDFHVGYLWDDNGLESLSTLLKYGDRFLVSEDELKSLLQRYFDESGGVGDWRMFELDGNPNKNGWNLKYLRIHRHEGKFIVCDDKHHALRKEILQSPVEQKYLNHN